MRHAFLIPAALLCAACASERALAPTAAPELSRAKASCQQTADGCADPLFIVDGKVVQSKLQDIELDGSTIESVEVIKGEAARLIYGESARHGVVIIRTKTKP